MADSEQSIQELEILPKGEADSFPAKIIKLPVPGGQEQDVSFTVEDSETDNPRVREALATHDHVLGIMDSEGKIYFTKEKLTSLSAARAGYSPVHSPVVLFEWTEGENQRIFIDALDVAEANQTIAYLKKAGVDNEREIRIGLRKNWYDANYPIHYEGKIKDYASEKKFVRDSTYPITPGYEIIQENKSQERLQELFNEGLKNSGKMLVRTDKVPRLPEHVSSASLFILGKTDKFFPREWFEHAGGIIYFLPENTPCLCFEQDAGSAIHLAEGDIMKTRLINENYPKSQIDGTIISWMPGVKPVPLQELFDKLNAVRAKSWNEVIFNPRGEGIKVLGIINPEHVSGWTRIAKKLGVAEFQTVPIQKY